MLPQVDLKENWILPPLRALVDKLPGITVHADPYCGPFEAYHHHATQTQTWDVAAMEAVIGRRGGPVLDIGCGRGRLALRLAAGGLRVTAIDTSAESLTHLRRAVETNPDLAARIDVVHGDITDRSLLEPDQFGVAALADLSINMFASETAIQRLLASVKYVLKADGLLCIPVLRPDSLRTVARLNGVTVIPFDDDRGTQRLLWVVLKHRAEGPYFERTLFVQDDNSADGLVRGDVTAVRERLWTASTLEPLLHAAGLCVVDTESLVPPSPSGWPNSAELLSIQAS